MTQTPTTELLSVVRAMRDYIDALPSDVVASLPTMPGFDRDWADEVIEAANREAQPVAFDALADAVKEVTGGIRMEFTPGTYKGHQPVPFMNFTSLSRIVEMFRTAPLVPEEVYYDDCPDLYPSQPDAWAAGYNACRAAMLAAAPESGNDA